MSISSIITDFKSKITDNSIVLKKTLLPLPAVDMFIESIARQNEISIKEITSNETDNTFIVNGETSILGKNNVKITIELVQVADYVDFSVIMELPPDWILTDGFTELKETCFSNFTITGNSIKVITSKSNDQIEAKFQANHIDYPGKAFDIVIFPYANEYKASWNIPHTWDKTVPLSGPALNLLLKLPGNITDAYINGVFIPTENLNIPLQAIQEGNSTIWKFKPGFETIPLKNLEDISSIIGSGPHVQQVLAFLHRQSNFVLGNLEYKVDKDTGKKLTTAFAISSNNNLEIIPGLLSLLAMTSNISIDHTEPDIWQSISGKIEGKIKIANIELAVTSYLPGFNFYSSLNPEEVIHLKDFLGYFIGNTEGIPDVKITEFNLLINITAKVFQFHIQVKDILTLSFGQFNFGLQELTIEFNYQDKSVSGFIEGQVYFNESALSLKAVFPEKNNGWIFEGKTPDGCSIHVTDMIATVLSGMVTLPENIPDVSLSDVFISCNTRNASFKCSATIEGKAVFIDDIPGMLGIHIPPGLLPHIGFALKRFEFDQSLAALSIDGKIETKNSFAEIGLDLQFKDYFDLSLSYRSEKTACITIGELIESTLPASWVQLLPKNEKSSGSLFLDKLKNSGLYNLQFNIDTQKKEVSLFAGGNILGLDGSVWFSVISVDGQMLVSLKITGAEDNIDSIPGFLKNRLGITVGKDIEAYLPKMKFALTELSFSQMDARFSLAGIIAQGFEEVEGIKGYRLKSELDVEWKDGIKVAVLLDATEAPMTLTALAKDLPLSLEAVEQVIPKKVTEKIGATAFHNLLVGVDTGAGSVNIKGTARLFGSIIVSCSFDYTEKAGLKFNTDVSGDMLSIREIVELIGISADPEFLPEVKLALSVISFDQEAKLFKLTGAARHNDSELDGGLNITWGKGAIIDLSLNAPKKPLTILGLVECLPVPGIDIKQVLPAGLLDEIAFHYVYIHFEAEAQKLSIKGRMGFFGSVVDSLLEIGKSEKKHYLALNTSIDSVNSNNLFEKIGIAPIEGLPELSFKDVAFTLNTLNETITFKGKSALDAHIAIRNTNLIASLDIDVAYNPKQKLTGFFFGNLTIGNMGFDAELRLDESNKFIRISLAKEKKLNFKEVARFFLGASLFDTLPKDLQHNLDGVNIVAFDSKIDIVSKEFSLETSSFFENISFGLKEFGIKKANIRLKLNVSGSRQYCLIEVQGSGTLGAEIDIASSTFKFEYDHKDGKTGWFLGGELAIDVLGRYIDFKAAASGLENGQSISFETSFAAALHEAYFSKIEGLQVQPLFKQLTGKAYVKAENDKLILQDNLIKILKENNIDKLELDSTITPGQKTAVFEALKKIQSGKTVNVGEILTFSFDKFELKLELKDKKPESWRVAGTADFIVHDIFNNTGTEIVKINKGSIELGKDKEKNELSLVLKADEAAFKPLRFIPIDALPEYIKDGFTVGIHEIFIKKKNGWSIGATAYFQVNEVDETSKGANDLKAIKNILDSIFPAPGQTSPEDKKIARRLNGTFSVSTVEGISIAVENKAFCLKPNFSEIIKSAIDESLKNIDKEKWDILYNTLKGLKDSIPDIGKAYACLDKIDIKINDKDSSCTAELSVGLPSKLNKVLFASLPGLFNKLEGVLLTYDENKGMDTKPGDSKKEGENNNNIGISLTLSEKGLSGGLTNFPPVDWALVLTKIGEFKQELKTRIENGIQFRIKGSDKLVKITDKDDNNNSSLEGKEITEIIINFDGLMGKTEETFGAVSITMPTAELSFTSGSFTIKGGIKVLSNQLAIPLPYQWLFNMIGEPEIGECFPEKIPIQTISFFDDQNNLNLAKLEKFVDGCMPPKYQPFKFPRKLTEIAEGLGHNLINKMPDRLKGYMGIYLPKGFHFSLNITPDGAFNVAVEIDSPEYIVNDGNIAKLNSKGLVPPKIIAKISDAKFKTTYKTRFLFLQALHNITDENLSFREIEEHRDILLKAFGGDNFCDSLQMLLPLGLVPQFIGFRLRYFAIGTALGETALRMDFSGEVDIFDLVELGIAALLPEKTKDSPVILPDCRAIRQSLILDQLIVFIFYEGGIPIPVPVYAREFDLQVANFTGSRGRFRWYVDLQVGLKSILLKLKDILEFFCKQDKYLPVKSDVKVALDAGPDYIMLPGLLGYEHDGNDKDQKQISFGLTDEKVIDLFELTSITANTCKALLYNALVPVDENKNIKKKPLNYFIEYFPQKDRYGEKNIKLFYLFDLYAKWAISTPPEFEQVMHSLMLKEPPKKAPGMPGLNSPADMLSLVFNNHDVNVLPADNQGLLAFIMGGIEITKDIHFEGAIGVSICEHGGFKTGVSVRGRILDFIESASSFFLKIDPNSDNEKLRILGNSHLKIFNNNFFTGHIEVSENGMDFEGLVNTAGNGSLIRFNGCADGIIKPGTFYFHAETGLQLGQMRAVSKILIDINNDHFRISASFQSTVSELKIQVINERSPKQNYIQSSFSASLFKFFRLNGDICANYQNKNIKLEGYAEVELAVEKTGNQGLGVLHLQLLYGGELNNDIGCLGIFAQLAPNSYLLSKYCRASGGVALYSWFSGEHKGDFVLTAGGYHPGFLIPAHYPVVPRLSIGWKIDLCTTISGQAYIAITPAMIMAGVNIQMIYEFGSLRAWFIACSDFCCYWEPLYFKSDVSVQVGASYSITVFGWTTTFNLWLDAVLKLWGPPTGGSVAIKLPIVTININFGEPYDPLPNINSWDAFKKRFLNDKILQIVPLSGIQKIKKETWFIKPDEFCFTINTSVPFTFLGGKRMAKEKLNIKPLVNTVDSYLSIDMPQDAFGELKFELQETNGNAALWGKTGINLLDGNNAVVKDLCTGVKVRLPGNNEIRNTKSIYEKNFGYTNIHIQKSFTATKTESTLLSAKKGNTDEMIGKTTNANNNIRKAIEALELFTIEP